VKQQPEGMRWLVAALFVVHGLIHLMGFVKAFGFAAMPQLTQPISKGLGVAWLAAGVTFVVAALLPWRLLWPVGAVALVLSQGVIVSSWSDAKFGTVANVIALGGVGVLGNGAVEPARPVGPRGGRTAGRRARVSAGADRR
jgi:hypothetical protein